MTIPLIVLTLELAAQQANGTTGQHDHGVKERGAHVMGFDQDATVHHFRLHPDGGAIDIAAKDPTDPADRDAIRSHLPHITQMFGNGDFSAPMLIHDTNVPGTDQMAALSTGAIGALNSTEVQNWTTTQLGALTSKQLGGLTTTAIDNFSETQMGDLTSTQVRGFTVSQINSMSTTALTALDVADLSSTQIKGVNATAIGNLSETQAQNLTTDQIAALWDRDANERSGVRGPVAIARDGALIGLDALNLAFGTRPQSIDDLSRALSRIKSVRITLERLNAQVPRSFALDNPEDFAMRGQLNVLSQTTDQVGAQQHASVSSPLISAASQGGLHW